MMKVMAMMMMTMMSRTRRHRTFVPPSKNSPRHAGYLASDIHSVFLQPRLAFMPMMIMMKTDWFHRLRNPTLLSSLVHCPDILAFKRQFMFFFR